MDDPTLTDALRALILPLAVDPYQLAAYGVLADALEEASHPSLPEFRAAWLVLADLGAGADRRSSAFVVLRYLVAVIVTEDDRLRAEVLRRLEPS